jgi:Uma2 family endonuclease
MLLSSLDPNKVYSYADYYAWDCQQRVELINGKVFEMSPAPSAYHQEITLDTAVALRNFLKGKDCKVYIAPFDVRLPQKSKDDKEIFTVLQPDICVICDPAKIDRRGCIGAPDIVVEVLSPGNNAKEMNYKYTAYEQAGVQEYWVISPQNQLVFFYQLTNSRFVMDRINTVGDIVASSVLPGFTLNLEELFKSAPVE